MWPPKQQTQAPTENDSAGYSIYFAQGKYSIIQSYAHISSEGITNTYHSHTNNVSKPAIFKPSKIQYIFHQSPVCVYMIHRDFVDRINYTF